MRAGGGGGAGEKRGTGGDRHITDTRADRERHTETSTYIGRG